MPGLDQLRCFVGSYTASSGGHAAGISVVRASDHAAAGAGGLAASTAAVIDDPSFLALEGDRLYAVSETSEGSLHAFAWNGTALDHRWDAPTGGDAPCHVRVSSGVLLSTNYMSGSVAALPVALADERVAAARAMLGDHLGTGHGTETATRLPADLVHVQELPSTNGPVADRQDGPHAHQTLPTPWGTVLIADLGGDTLHEVQIRPDGTIEPLTAHSLAPGVGPRHMVWSGQSLFVTGELDGRVHRLERDPSGRMIDVASIDAVDGGTHQALLSHIDIDEAGHLFVAVRGADTIVVFDTADGRLAHVGSAPSGGTWPRHFARVSDYLLVANERSDLVSVLPLGPAGVPGRPVAQIPVGSPTCVLPF